MGLLTDALVAGWVAVAGGRRAEEALSISARSGLGSERGWIDSHLAGATRALSPKNVVSLKQIEVSSSARTKSTVSARLGPFVPGTGGLPPCLAGREREQSEIDDYLDALRSGEPPPSMLIFYGPRGNGKTTLLNWTRRQALGHGVQSVSLDTAQILTAESLARHLLPDSWLTRIFEGISWRGTDVRLRNPETSNVTKALARLTKKSPMVFLIDEAHTLDTTLGAQLLQAAQTLATDGVPFLLILAGTPSLPSHLRKMHATFWERSAIFPLQRLDPSASSEAIRTPFKQDGFDIVPEALERMVEDSHGYPYFLQLWGKALWSLVRESSGPIRMQDVNRVRPQFEETRNRFYGERYEELRERGLVAPAVALAHAYEGIDSLDNYRVVEALKGALEADGQEIGSSELMRVRQELHNLGYIWSPSGARKRLFFSGIPSLMSYVADVDSH